MAFRTPKDGGENALWDGNRHPVQLVYDEENDTIKMMRSDADGNLIVVGSVIDNDGNVIKLSGESQNNQNQLMVNNDDVMDALGEIHAQLRIMNFHLGHINDMNITKEDLE
jgi:hypothetical protein